MKASLKPAGARRTAFLFAITAALVAALAFILLPAAQPALADGGGWPTSTWTPLPTWTQTPIPTLGGIIFPPTPTFTVAAPSLLQQGQGIPESQLQVQLATEPAPSRSLTSVLCWPLGIVALILLVLGAILIRNKIVVNA